MEIDLQELKVITQVETQGRFGNGQASWAKFKVHAPCMSCDTVLELFVLSISILQAHSNLHFQWLKLLREGSVITGQDV